MAAPSPSTSRVRAKSAQRVAVTAADAVNIAAAAGAEAVATVTNPGKHFSARLGQPGLAFLFREMRLLLAQSEVTLRISQRQRHTENISGALYDVCDRRPNGPRRDVRCGK